MKKSLFILFSTMLTASVSWAQDVKIELVFVTPEEHGKRARLEFKEPFLFEAEHNGIYTFVASKIAQRIGMWDCAVRVIPSHALLPHDQDFNIVRWI